MQAPVRTLWRQSTQNHRSAPNYLGPNYYIWHDPIPKNSGRGVVIAFHQSLGNAKLSNINHIKGVRECNSTEF